MWSMKVRFLRLFKYGLYLKVASKKTPELVMHKPVRHRQYTADIQCGDETGPCKRKLETSRT